jgi:hypothetical protein
LSGFAVLAQLLGLEIILGAFIAGTVLRLVDKDGMMTHTFSGRSWRRSASASSSHFSSS